MTKKIFKKILSISLAIVLTAALAACGSKTAAKDAAGDSAGAQSTAAQTAAAPDDSSDRADGSADENNSQAAAGTGQESSAESVEIPETPYVREDGGVSIDVFAMDTYMNLLAYGDRAEEAVLAAAQEIHRIDDMLSTGNPESEISKLNAAGTGSVSEDTLYLIKESKNLYDETGGLFDIAIYPVMKLWGFPTQQYRVPAADQTLCVLLDLHQHIVSWPADRDPQDRRDDVRYWDQAPFGGACSLDLLGLWTGLFWIGGDSMY